MVPPLSLLLQLALLCPILGAPVVSPQSQWVAVFFNTSEAKRCLQDHYRLTPSETPTMQCGHSTVEYDPRPDAMQRYSSQFGAPVQLRVLAYARDDHAQALLVRYSGVGGGGHRDTPISTTNLYPHVTVANSKYPYTAVYSSALWERAEEDSPLQIGRAAQGVNDSMAPNATTLPNNSSSWTGKVPAFNSTTVPLKNNELYPPTTVEIAIPDPGAYRYDGTFCVNTQWNQYTGLCEPAFL